MVIRAVSGRPSQSRTRSPVAAPRPSTFAPALAPVRSLVSRWMNSSTRPPGVAVWLLPWRRSRACWGSARTPTALARRTSRGSVSPRLRRRVARSDDGVVEAEGVEGVQAQVEVGGGWSGVVDQGHVPGGEGEVFVGVGAVGVVVQDCLVDDPPDPHAVRWPGSQASIVSTQVTISGVSDGVRAAAWRARQAGTVPSRTRSKSRGSRCRSSRASPISCRPASWLIPRCAASSAGANSATRGCPHPRAGPGLRRAGRPLPTRPAPHRRGRGAGRPTRQQSTKQLGGRGELGAAGGAGTIQDGAEVRGRLDRDVEHVFDSSRRHRQSPGSDRDLWRTFCGGFETGGARPPQPSGSAHPKPGAGRHPAPYLPPLLRLSPCSTPDRRRCRDGRCPPSSTTDRGPGSRPPQPPDSGSGPAGLHVGRGGAAEVGDGGGDPAGGEVGAALAGPSSVQNSRGADLALLADDPVDDRRRRGRRRRRPGRGRRPSRSTAAASR